MPEPSNVFNIARILLIEDNPDDAEWVRRVFQRGHLGNPLAVIEDGAKALDVLSRSANDPSGPAFDLVLLDLTLPGLDGRTLFKHFAEDRRLRKIPVIVLTGSQREEDMVSAYKTGAVAFLRKPIDMERFLGIVGDLYGNRLYIVRQPESD